MPGSGGPAWSAVLTGDAARTALRVAADVAMRSTDPERLRVALAAAVRQTHYPNTIGWDPAGVAQGDAGLALLCACADACFPGRGWDETAHGFLAQAARAAEGRASLPVGLFSGLAGLALATWSLSRGGTRYRRLLRSIDDALLPQSCALASTLAGRRNGAAVGEFDVISGLSGVGAYLLCRRGEPAPRAALEAVLAGLVALTRAGVDPPAWYTPAELMGDEALAARYPRGNLNCGLAHGIPGPLALMALALREQVEVPGLPEAVREIAAWLVAHRIRDAWGVNWPTVVAVEPTGGGEPDADPEPSRAAWCYGSPGVARALWLAGDALGDSGLEDLAVAAMEAVYRQPVAYRRIDSPTFCHGVAGLLQVTVRFAHDTGGPVFFAAAASIAEQLLASYDPEVPLGYRSLEPGGNQVDQPGLLDGSAGVPMALLAAATDVEPFWDRLFLLS